jgi:DNA-binding LacI/PurR family transcriptional regulator
MSEPKDKIYAALLERIETGVYPAGSKLPAGRDLASEFEVSHWAVHNTLTALEEKGFVESRRSVGVFVRSNVPLDRVRRHKNNFSKNVTVVVSRDFFYAKHGFEDIVSQTERLLEQSGHNVSYDNLPESADAIRRFMGELSSAGTKSLLIFPERKEWEIMHRFSSLLANSAVNIFYYNRGLGPNDTLPFNCATLDMSASGALAAEWIISKGFENIVYASYDSPGSYWPKARYEGFNSLLGYHNKTHHFLGGPAPESVLAPALGYVKKCGAPPVLAACNDQWAAPLYNHLSDNGLAPGKDFHILSFDDLPIHRNCKKINVTWPLDKIGEIIAGAVESAGALPGHEYFAMKLNIKPVIIDRT